LGIETVTKIASEALGLVTNPRFWTDLLLDAVAIAAVAVIALVLVLLLVVVVAVAATTAVFVVEDTATKESAAKFASADAVDPS
jgi:hypothetical protein